MGKDSTLFLIFLVLSLVSLLLFGCISQKAGLQPEAKAPNSPDNRIQEGKNVSNESFTNESVIVAPPSNNSSVVMKPSDEPREIPPSSDRCNSDGNYSAVFVLVPVDKSDADKDMIKLQTIQDEFEKDFAKATGNRGRMNFREGVVVVNWTDDFDKVCGWSNKDEVLRNFYSIRNDSYDYVFIFPDNAIDCENLGNDVLGGISSPVQNYWKNNGLEVVNNSGVYGVSNLKGLTVFGSMHCLPDQYDPVKSGMPAILHEAEHFWAAYATHGADNSKHYDNNSFSFTYGKLGLLDGDGHYASTFFSEADPLGGRDWKQEGDVYYAKRDLWDQYVNVGNIEFSPLTLYLMGLVKADELRGTNFSILEPTEYATDYVLAHPDMQAFRGYVRHFTIDDVIKASGGEVECASQ